MRRQIDAFARGALGVGAGAGSIFHRAKISADGVNNVLVPIPQ